MNRRGFLAALVAVAVAPKALDALQSRISSEANDYDRWPPDFTDLLTSTSVHGLSAHTHSEWSVAFP